eukprot:205886_1
MGNFWTSEIDETAMQIPITIHVPDYAMVTAQKHKFVVVANYRNDSVKDVIDKSIRRINGKLHPAKYKFDFGDDEGSLDNKIKTCLAKFMEKQVQSNSSSAILDEMNSITTVEAVNAFMRKYMDSFLSAPLTTFSKNELVSNGFQLECSPQPYQQNVLSPVTCPHLLSSNNKQNVLNCPIYKVMKEEYLWNEENFNHLDEHMHFEDKGSQPECKYASNCKSYKKMIIGQLNLSDRCHCKIYRHPPRSAHIALSKDIHPFTYVNSEQKTNILTIYNPLNEFKDTSEVNPIEASTYTLNALITEVVNNGYKKDLCLDKEEDFKNDNYTLMNIVKEKMNHQRHKMMGSPLQEYHILALLLYTGCDCNHDLCLTQRNGDYNKWKVFDFCLNAAIHRLCLFERGRFKVYSGVCGVKFDTKQMNMIYLPTFTSTTWKKEVAKMFVGAEGVILELDDELRSLWPCCDVSWISHFDEYEILFSRLPPRTTQLNDYFYALECEVIDNDEKGVQIVSVKMKKVQNKIYHDSINVVWANLIKCDTCT